MDALSQFIQNNPDPRELKRALAVQMSQRKQKHREIQAILQVSSGFISKWRQMFEQQGVDGLRLRHIGSVGYLNWQQRVAVINWLKQKNYWNLLELQTHIEEQYGVMFESNQSYYDLFAQAGISWKKTQRSNPKKDPQMVEKKTRYHGMAGVSPPGD